MRSPERVRSFFATFLPHKSNDGTNVHDAPIELAPKRRSTYDMEILNDLRGILYAVGSGRRVRLFTRPLFHLCISAVRLKSIRLIFRSAKPDAKGSPS